MTDNTEDLIKILENHGTVTIKQWKLLSNYTRVELNNSKGQPIRANVGNNRHEAVKRLYDTVYNDLRNICTDPVIRKYYKT